MIAVDNLTNISESAIKVTSEFAYDDIMSRTWLRVVFIALYCIIFVVGVSGNSLVVYIVARNKILQTPTNIFITNLAVSDIMICLLAVPFTPVSGMTESWVLGEALCRIVPMSMGVSVHVSTQTSTAIAIDRYFAIVHPFKARLTARMCLAVIVIVWVTSLTISLPMAVYQDLTFDDESAVFACLEVWPWPSARRLFTLASLGLQYLVPCSIITVCYSRVSAALRRRSKSKKGLQTPTFAAISAATTGQALREQQELRRKRRTTNMLIAMVSIFVCCWLPLNVINLTVEYLEALGTSSYYLFVFFVAHVIAMSSTIYNPFLYAYMNDAFRKEFQKVLPRCLMASDGGGGVGGRYGDVNVRARLLNSTVAFCKMGAEAGDDLDVTAVAVAAAAAEVPLILQRKPIDNSIESGNSCKSNQIQVL